MVTKEEIVAQLAEAQKKMANLRSRSDATELEQMIVNIREQRNQFMDQERINGIRVNTPDTRLWSKTLDTLANKLENWKEPEVIVEKKVEATAATTVAADGVAQLTSSSLSKSEVGIAAVNNQEQLTESLDALKTTKSLVEFVNEIVAIKKLLEAPVADISKLKRDNTIEDILDVINKNYEEKGMQLANDKKSWDGFYVTPIYSKLSSNRQKIIESLNSLEAQVQTLGHSIHTYEFDTYKRNIRAAYRTNDLTAATEASNVLEIAFQNDPGLWGTMRSGVNYIIQLISQALGATKGDAFEGKFFHSQGTKILRGSQEYKALLPNITQQSKSEHDAESPSSPRPKLGSSDEPDDKL